MTNAATFQPVELRNVAGDVQQPTQDIDAKQTDRNKRIKQVAWSALAVLAGLGAVVSGFAAIAFLFNAIASPAAIPFFKLSGFLGAFALSVGTTVYASCKASGECEPKTPGEKVAPTLAAIEARNQKV